uniref:Ribosome assembly factor mrt4 n=1 Tax=Oryza punctata TaxID=4537 RepID=A0A0E0MBH8_ORYPU
MPKSKRNRPVTLSKTKKKPGLERKGKVVADIKDAVDNYANAYVFTYDNMRNQKLKDLREQLKSSSRIFLAGKKVMQIALGRSPADEAKTGLHKLSKRLLGMQMATFRLYLVCRWSCDDFETYKEGLAQLRAGEADDSP